MAQSIPSYIFSILLAKGAWRMTDQENAISIPANKQRNACLFGEILAFDYRRVQLTCDRGGFTGTIIGNNYQFV